MRNDELKHYGVKGMKWRNHKYVVRDGNNGDYGYNYGNNGNAYNKSGSGANTYRAPKLTPVQQRNSRTRQYKKVTLSSNGSYGAKSSGVRSSSKTKKPVQQQFGVVGKQKLYDSSNTGRMKRKDRQKYNRAPSTNKTSAGGRTAYKPTVKINNPTAKNKKTTTRTDRRVTQNLYGDRKLSAIEIAANKARNADTPSAKKRRQDALKSKLSAEVRAKTLNEAIRKAGRSVSSNSPMLKQKLKRDTHKAATISKIDNTLRAKDAARKKRISNAQKAETEEKLNKLKKTAQSRFKKKLAATKRKKQIENAKKWVNSKLNDAGNFVNARKKDAGKFINSVKKDAEKTYNKVTKPRTSYKLKSGKKYTTKKNNGYERAFGKGSNKWIKEAKPTKLSNFLNDQFNPKIGTAKKKKKKKK